MLISCIWIFFLSSWFNIRIHIETEWALKALSKYLDQDFSLELIQSFFKLRKKVQLSSVNSGLDVETALRIFKEHHLGIILRFLFLFKNFFFEKSISY